MKSLKQTIRPFRHDDLGDVASLFLRTFQSGKTSSPALVSALAETFLDHPQTDTDLSSLVLEKEAGGIGGFIGVIPARMMLGERSVRAACAGSMMVEHPKENPLAGGRLLRAFLAGPQDLSISETANATALGMWRGLGHDIITPYSLNWLRPLRLGAMATAIAANAHPAGGVLKPFGRLADTVARYARIEPFSLPKPKPRGLEFHDADAPDMAQALMALAGEYALRPDWDETTLGWLLAQASQKPLHGDMVRRVARDGTGRPAGAYVYYGRPGGIAWTLQLLARPDRIESTVDDMLRHAYATGCAAIRGSGQPWLNSPLLARKTLFFGRSFTVAHTKDAEIRKVLDSGAALVSGLAGETWSPLIGNRFS